MRFIPLSLHSRLIDEIIKIYEDESLIKSKYLKINLVKKDISYLLSQIEKELCNDICEGDDHGVCDLCYQYLQKQLSALSKVLVRPDYSPYDIERNIISCFVKYGNVEILIDDDGCSVELYRNWAPKEQADALFEDLCDIEWEKKELIIVGKKIPEPRYTYACGDEGVVQEYSGISREMNPWIPSVYDVINRVNIEFDTNLNSCLLNDYRTGNDYIGLHADKEIKPPRNIVITLSLGETRKFYFKNNQTGERVEVWLNHRDLIKMEGDTNKKWKHTLPKCTKANKSYL